MVAKSRKKKAKKKKAKKKTAKKVKAAVAAKKDKIKCDKFGSRIGGRNAAINAVLSTKPQKMAELTKLAKVPGTYYCHLAELIKKGIVKKSKDGFALA